MPMSELISDVILIIFNNFWRIIHVIETFPNNKQSILVPTCSIFLCRLYGVFVGELYGKSCRSGELYVDIIESIALSFQ
jgi:hypothetical protein